MNLFEIYESSLIKPTDQNVDVDSYRKNLPTQIGAGNYSTVFQDEEPHTVTKAARSNLAANTDGYWTYLKEIEDRNLMDNPHFPRFYVNKTFKDKEGEQVTAGAELEKLYPMTSMSFKEGLTMFDRLFGDPTQNKVLTTLIKKVKKERMIENKPDPIRNLVPIIVGYVYNVTVVPRQTNTIKDDTFKEAVEALRSIKRDHGRYFYWDIKADNLMVRKTPYGPQLVFADPFA